MSKGEDIRGKDIPPGCVSVKLACFGGREPTSYLLFNVVRPGVWVTSYCFVKMVFPNPCWWVPFTVVSVVDHVDVNVERLESNYFVTVRFYDKYGSPSRVEHYVYPIKVWDRVQDVVKPLLEGRPPRNPGVIFIGPPGTGKTSLLRILPEYLGLSVVEIGPEHVLSKWVGESEANVAMLFSKAEQMQPSAVLLDEGDWVLSPSRSTYGLGEVMQNIMGIVKRKLAEHYKRGDRVLTMFAANLAESAIDSTLKREGRCGKPIVIPLPDYEAIYSYLTMSAGIEAGVAEKMALNAVNAGLSMADVVQMANTYKEIGRYWVEPMKYRGYRRHVVDANVLNDRSVRELLEALEIAYEFTSIASYSKARVWVSDLPAVITLPVVSAVVGLIARKPVVVLDHDRYIDEALDMINLLGATAIVNHTVIHTSEVKTLWQTADFPIIFIGTEQPPVEHHRIPIRGVLSAHRTGVVKLLTTTYNLKVDEQTIKDLKSRTETDFYQELEKLVLTGRIVKAKRPSPATSWS